MSDQLLTRRSATTPLAELERSPAVAASSASADDADLARVLEAYLAELEAGRRPERAALLAAHPHLAERLDACLASLEFLETAGDQVRADASHDGLATAIEHPASGIQHPLTPATLGDFRLLREVGRGGMGVVYEAEQLSLGRRVALKVLPFAAMLDERQLARFKNEARAAASLHHPHIVPVYSVGAERGVHFYAMQYIEGTSLAEMRTAECGMRNRESTDATSAPNSALRIPPSALDTKPVAALATERDPSSPAHFHRLATLAAQAAAALHHAHESGVIHRDIKPSNLLVERGHGRAEKLWVADFGLARIAAEPTMTLSGDIVGTLRYMSPEQLRGRAAQVDHRTDVYSLGITLYELTAGRAAFPGDDSEQLLRQILTADPPPPRTLNRAIPADFETVILKAIRKDAADRYATAQELADDLRRFVAAKPIVARRPTPLDRAVMWARRHTRLVLAAAAALLAIAVTTAVAAVLTTRAWREQARQTQLANDRLRFAREVVDDMYTKVAEGWLANQPRMTPLQQEFLDKAAAFYREIATQSAGDPRWEVDAALASWRLATIAINQRRLADAGPLLRGALQQLDAALTAAPADPERQHARALVAMTLAATVGEQGDAREAARLNAEAGAAWSDLARRFPDEPKYVARQADIWQNLGTSLAVPNPAAAEPHLRRAIAGYEQALAADYQPSQTPIDLARTRINLSVALDNLHRHDEARAELVAALTHLDSTGPIAIAAPDIRALAAGAWYQLARQHRHLNQEDDARRAIEQAITLGERLVKEFPDRPTYREHLDGAITLRAKLPQPHP